MPFQSDSESVKAVRMNESLILENFNNLNFLDYGASSGLSDTFLAGLDQLKERGLPALWWRSLNPTAQAKAKAYKLSVTSMLDITCNSLRFAYTSGACINS